MARLKKREAPVAEFDTGYCLPWKAHRLRGKVTLEAITEVTKISKRFLEAIEGGLYGELPGGVFTTSYIRQYAALIDYDSEEILLHQAGGVRVQEPGKAEGGRSWGKGLIGGVLEKG